MRKVTFVLGLCILAVSAFKVWSYARITQTNATATPVTIIYQIKNYDGNGKSGPTDILVRAYRADGSEVQYLVDPGGLTPIRTVFNFERRIQASIDPLIKGMVTLPIANGPRIPATCAGMWGEGRCLGSVLDKVSGFDFALERVTETGADGYANEFLVAPSLDFKPLKRVLTLSNGTLLQEWTAIDVRLGEPDAALFEIPSGYEVMTRDVYYERGMTARSRQPSAAVSARFRALDQGKQPPAGCGK